MRQANYYDVLKVVALIAMTLDHVAFFLMPQMEWFRIVGRIAAPIFLLLVGYNGSYRFRPALLMAALAVTAMDAAFLSLWFPQNILWTILITRLVLQHVVPRFGAGMVGLAAMLFVPVSMPLMDFGTLAIVFALAGQCLQRGRKKMAALWLVGGLTLFCLWSAAVLFEAPTLPLLVCLVAVLSGLGLVLWRCDYGAAIRVMPVTLRWCAANALYYYVGHKLILEWMFLTYR